MWNQNGVNENALYAGPSCMICQFWLFTGQRKSIANQQKLLYAFGSKKWRLAWLMSFISGNQTTYQTYG